MKYKYTFTVFTPIYNRAHTLHRVYESLKTQTLREFEWLIVDDGSTDDARTLIEKWRTEAAFPIRYVYQENQGKHVAFNHGVRLAEGELFLTLDSDDACVPDALERFKYHWDAIPSAELKRFSAVTALCMDQHGRIVGDKFPENITDSDSLEIHYKYKVKGEKWGFQTTAVLREFLFPLYDDLKFVPEGIIWSAIARKYKTRFVNETLRIYWLEDKNNADRLSKLNPSTAKGRSLYHKTVLNEHLDWFTYSPMSFIRSSINFSRYSFYAGIGLRKQAGQLRSCPRLLWFVLLPVGFLVYLGERK